LKARQCRKAGGLRAKNELLTINAKLRYIARAVEDEEAKAPARAKQSERSRMQKTTTQTSLKQHTARCQHEAKTSRANDDERKRSAA
jgi:hypothetical protein